MKKSSIILSIVLICSVSSLFITGCSKASSAIEPIASAEPTADEDLTATVKPTTADSTTVDPGVDPTGKPDTTGNNGLTGSAEPVGDSESKAGGELTEAYEPTTTIAPTATTEPDQTQKPTATTEPDQTQKPTATTEPGTTQKPTATTEPGTTQKPTATTEPDQTQQSTATPKPTEVPEIKKSDNPAPDFTVTLLDGSDFTLSSQLGNVVLVNFWATWCGPCMAELPELQNMYEEYGDEVVFIGIELGDAEDEVREAVDDNGLTYLIGIDDYYGTISAPYSVEYIPYTVVIGRDGAIVADYVGGMTEADIRNLINQALN